MLTRQEITIEPNALDITAVNMLLPLVRNGIRYRTNPSLFSNIQTKIASTVGTVKAQQINGALRKIEEIGGGDTNIRGGEDALDYSKSRDRELWVNYIIGVLYVVSEVGSGFAIEAGSGGGTLVAQRDVVGDLI